MHYDRLMVSADFKINKEKDYVLYWMQQSQRIDYNYALSEAIKIANTIHKPLKVVFVLTPSFKEANLRHYTFMLEGLYALVPKMNALNIDFVMEMGAFEDVLTPLMKEACAFILDKSYLAPLRTLKSEVMRVAKALKLYTVMVDADLIVPVEKTSQKCEYGARTIRGKLLKVVDDYLDECPIERVLHAGEFSSSLFEQPIEATLTLLKCDDTIKKSPYFKGGYGEALNRLNHFIENALNHYPESNDPSKNYTSTLSPYLHFGQISTVEVYLSVHAKLDQFPVAVENYLEQLLVRRELAYNYVYYCDGYDQFETMTDAWAYETMKIHIEDKREYLYTKDDYIQFKTHDVYFNAAMKEMVKTGFMHNYMRMYWGKKIIEWSPDYKTAYETILSLNNAYFIDGRDPNSYAGVAWCFGKHDRAWQTNAVFGKLRYMNSNGLKRKFDIASYVLEMDKL
ncbi:deoxyribodipyrimidine photo-lyase [Liberiplasma polymorphum]|uniref:deoxyribodipyrimidine photo-lyase n=1 Tax=Liberiplasma polymorphum TaxID=3374570 RepID=UPI0037735B12